MRQPRVRGVPCPHSSPRPKGVRTSLIVLHSTDGTFESALDWFQHPESRVSSHYVVARDGRIVQCVKLEDQAWHAGVSRYQRRPRVNRFSIGIEMEHIDGLDDWPNRQLKAVARLCRWLMEKYALALGSIVSHAEIARPAGRKVDPLDFPWDEFRRRVSV